jgi:hypothetical protein
MPFTLPEARAGQSNVYNLRLFVHAQVHQISTHRSTPPRRSLIHMPGCADESAAPISRPVTAPKIANFHQ